MWLAVHGPKIAQIAKDVLSDHFLHFKAPVCPAQLRESSHSLQRDPNLPPPGHTSPLPFPPILLTPPCCALPPCRFFAQGLTKLVLTYQVRHLSTWPSVLVSGMLSLVLSVLILAQWPENAGWVVGVLVGVDFIVTGISLSLLGCMAKLGEARGRQPSSGTPLCRGATRTSMGSCALSACETNLTRLSSPRGFPAESFNDIVTSAKLWI
jgi:hypothetical protein